MQIEKEIDEKLSLLREKGVVITTPRLLILEYLVQNKTHPTAEEIYQNLRKRFPSISLASIYNALKLFNSLGIVNELFLEREKARYDINTAPHAHFKCLKCGRIYDLLDINLPQIKEFAGHKILTTQVYFYGFCKACSQATSKSKKKEKEDKKS